MSDPKEDKDDDLSLFALTERYPTEESAISYFEQQRWGGSPVCPSCGSKNATSAGADRRLPLHQCRGCGHQFTVTSGTVMDHTMLPLRKWLLAFHLIGGSKKGVSSRFLARSLDVTPKTAWHLGHRIRATMAENDQLFIATVETDETYIGGKRKHVGQGYRGNKTAVQAIVNRSEGGELGKVQSIALQPEANHVDGRTVGAKLRTHTLPEHTVLMTDESKIYTKAGEAFKEHHTVNHKQEEYVREEPDGTLAHTNTVEGFFGNLKRQISGTHHHVSKKHLPRYLEEHDYKYNTRDKSDGGRTAAAIKNMEGKRVTLYKTAAGGDSLFDGTKPEDLTPAEKQKKMRACSRLNQKLKGRERKEAMQFCLVNPLPEKPAKTKSKKR